ncbi:MAG: S-layer homology domain-containing protein [Butyricicoccus sp.]|nr:S-layer homology domain-containing protein [Butyricicoccus sp.]
MKRLTSFILTIALLLSMLPAAFAADTTPSAVSDRITADTVWSYLDDGTDPAGDSKQEGYVRTSWTASDFDDSGWKKAAGPFGSKRNTAAYSSTRTANTVLAGCDGANDTPAYFFRTTFTIDSLEGYTKLVGSLEYDDGVIVYINGQKVAAGHDNACDASGNSLNHGFDANLQYGGSNAGPDTLEIALTDLSILKEGENTVAVELHNGRQTSSDVWFRMNDLALSAEKEVYQSNISLSMGADESQMNFTWYAATGENASLIVADNEALTGGQTVTAAAQLANDGQYSCKATATGLKANTTYYYQLANGGKTSEIRSFTTGGEGAFSFAYVGDPQIGASGNAVNDTNGWEKTLNIIDTNEIFSDASFLLSAGDQVNTASDEAQYDGYLDHDALLSLPVATVIGNHDSSSNAYGQHFNVANESDTLGTTDAGGDSYFVYNNVLFLVLNSNNKSPAEHKAFMEQAIEATKDEDIQWKIVTFHHSIYTVASHSSDSYITDPTGFKNSMAPIFKELDIDVVLQGHDHVYCRTYMMDGLTPITASDKYEYGNGADQAPTAVNDPEGILYVTANSGSGSKTYNIVNGDFPFSAVQNQGHVANVSKVDVSDKQFTISTYRTSDMSLVDTFTINRTSGSSSGGGSSSGSSSSSYKVTAADAAHGTVTADRTSVSAGATVTVTVKPDAGYKLDKLTVTDKNGRSVSLTSLGGGKYSFRMPSSDVKFTVSFAAETPAETGLPFTDVKTGDWFYDAAQYVYEKGMMAGTSSSAFSPNATTTRGMIVTILYRLENSPAVSGTASFEDIALGQYYADAVAWAVANDIVKGYSSGKFGPNDAITREQLAAILYRYAAFKGYNVTTSGSLDRFTDASAVSDYSVASVQWAVAGELISGMGDGTLAPQGNATRAQAAAILMRLCESLNSER